MGEPQRKKIKMIELVSDKCRITGPKVDKTMSLTFEFGEYMKKNVMQVMLLDETKGYKITVEEYDV